MRTSSAFFLPMKNRLVPISLILLFLNSCQQWRMEKENEERVSFNVENSDQKREKKKHADEKKIEEISKNSSAYVAKYAVELGVKPEELIAANLYEFIDTWLGTPYKYGGNTKEGIDCSGFVNAVYLSIYKIQLKRSATEIVNQCNIIDKKELKEGDLVFFDISGKNSHIGIYLVNNKFIHASSSKGVMISDLNQTYWVKYWGRAGRFKN